MLGVRHQVMIVKPAQGAWQLRVEAFFPTHLCETLVSKNSLRMQQYWRLGRSREPKNGRHC